jgi:hypothetical protein
VRTDVGEGAGVREHGRLLERLRKRSRMLQVMSRFDGGGAAGNAKGLVCTSTWGSSPGSAQAQGVG